MGLMLSVLVFCVGIIEALSCYEHFQYGVVHCATNLYENARRRSSAFLNYTTRRYRLLCEDSIAEDDDDDNGGEGNQPGSLVGNHDTLYEIKSNVRKVKARERKLGKDEKIDIVKKLLERPTRPRAVRSISMPELEYTEKDLELTRIINELAIEPIEEINVEIGIEEMDSETVAQEFDKLFIESEGGLKDLSVTSNGGVPGVFLDRERSFMTGENSMGLESVNKTEDEMIKGKKCESVTGESELDESKGKMSDWKGNRVEESGNGVTSDTGIDFMGSKDSDKKEENVCLVDNLISDRFNKGLYLNRSVSLDFDISSYFENRSLPPGKPKVSSVSKSSFQKSLPKIQPSDETRDFDNEIFEKVEGPVEVIEETFEKLYENLSEELPDLINDEEIIRVIDSEIDINDRSEINIKEVESPRQERKLPDNEVYENLYESFPDEAIDNVVDNDVVSKIDIEKRVEGLPNEENLDQDEAFEELYGNLSSDSQYFVTDDELSKVIDNIVDNVISNGINMSNIEFSKQKLRVRRDKDERNVSVGLYMELANRIVNACLEEIKNQRFEKLCREANYLNIEEEISKTKAFISKSENSCNDGTDFHLSDLISAKAEMGNQDGDNGIFLIRHFSGDPNQRFENYEKDVMPKAWEMKNSEDKFDEINGNESLSKDASQSQEKKILKDTNDLMNFKSTALEECLVEVENESTPPAPIIAMTLSGDKTEANIEDKATAKNFEKPKGSGNDKDTQILAITCPNFLAIEYKTIDTDKEVSFDECTGKRQEAIPMEWKVDGENEKPLRVKKVEGGEEMKLEPAEGSVNADAKDEQENLSKCENILNTVQETVVEENKGNENLLKDVKSESTGNLKVIEESENEKTKFTESSKKEVKEDDSKETCTPKDDTKGSEVDKTVKEDFIEVKEIKIDVEAQAAKDLVRDEESELVKDRNLCNGKPLVVAKETEVVEPETEVKVGDELEKGLEPKVVSQECGVDLVCQVTTLPISCSGDTGVESGGVKEMGSGVVESLPGDTQIKERSSETAENSRTVETKSEGSSFTVKDNVESKNDVPNEPKNLNRTDKSLKEGTEKNAAPEAFWLIFSGEYTKAMSKDWHSGHFSCWQCDEALTGQRYVLRDDHPYCIKCYESVFANVCEECNKIIGIDSKDLSYKDKHWHEACFLCNKCRVSLVDKQFGSKADKIYCGNCYDAQFASRCDGCGEIFRAGTKKMEYKTRQWHEKCFCCCVCKTPIGTKSFIPREQEIYCATCYEEKFATRCVKCNKIITSGGVTYKNEPWHRECFTCTNCNTSLAGQRFTSRDEKPYCADCFGELFAKRCTACSRPITGIGGTRFISFEDRHWHNDCFICASCKTSLVGRGFITDGDDIICPECAKQKLM